MIVTVRRYPQGPRCWVAGQRVHHGAVATVAAVALYAAKRRRLAAAVLLVAAHDRHDWRVWFAREGVPCVTKITHTALDSELSIP